jgi:hypothetical protein
LCIEGDFIKGTCGVFDEELIEPVGYRKGPIKKVSSFNARHLYRYLCHLSPFSKREEPPLPLMLCRPVVSGWNNRQYGLLIYRAVIAGDNT